MDAKKERQMMANVYDAGRMVEEYEAYLKRTTPEERERDRKHYEAA